MVRRAFLLFVLIGAGVADPVLTAQEGLRWERPADLAPTATVRRVFLEVRLAETEPVRGLTFEAPVKGSAKKVHIHYATVVTNGDLLKARVVEIGGRYEVGVTLTPSRSREDDRRPPETRRQTAGDHPGRRNRRGSDRAQALASE